MFASVMARSLAVLPVRVSVNDAVSVAPSVAVVSVLVMITVGRSSAAKRFATANARRPSGHCASTSTHCPRSLVGAKVKFVPKAGSWPRASQTTRALLKSMPGTCNVTVSGVLVEI